jgi:hypothetical protein
LRGHQEAEQALDAFLQAPEGRGYYTAALSRALAIGNPIVAASTRRLTSSNPDALLRLGDLLARFPGRQRVVQALTRVAYDRRGTGARRLGAFMLLEGLHLDSDGSEDAIYAVPDASEVIADALARLSGACAERVENCTDYAGFFRFLLSQPPDLLYGAVGVLAVQGGDAARGALRLLAMHPHPDLADAAIEALSLDDSPQAAHDLEVLARNLPHEGARLAERHLRKRLLSGLLPPAETTQRGSAGRALLSAIDGMGRRVLWVRWPFTESGTKQATLLLVIGDAAGITVASATRQVLTARFPSKDADRSRPFVWRPLENGSPLTASAFVEVELSYALRLLADAAKINWLSGTPLPLEYAILISSLWSAGGMEDGGPELEDSEQAEDGSAPVENESDLLSNPLFEGWYVDSHGVRAVARDVRAMGTANALTHDNWRILLPALIRLAHDEFGPELRAMYARRLRRMSEWFQMGGQETEAEMAASASRTMLQSPPEANLFVLRLLQRGVLMALGDWG